MRLAYAILADAAEFSNGKFSLLGGEFDTIRTAKFPTLHRGFSLLVKVDVNLDEAGHDHVLKVELVNPFGHIALLPLGGKFNPQANPEHPDRPIKALFILNFMGVVFEIPGTHMLRLSIDDEEAGTVPLYLEEDPTLADNLPM